MHYAEYLPILSPPDKINGDIQYYKSMCADKIGDFAGRHSRAHISIPFEDQRQKTFIAEPAIDRMEKRLNTMPPVSLHITGFDIFSNHVSGNTIYAAIDMNDKVKNWFKLLLKEMQLKKRSLTPHLTIARGISTEQLDIVWPYFMKQKFNYTFEVHELIVLKRELFSSETAFKTHKKLRFLNQFSQPIQNHTPTLF